MQIELSSPSKLPASLLPSLSSTIEYTIYAYSFFEDEKLGCNRWKRMTTSLDSTKAMLYAEGLYKSQQYQKIEIKKKSYHEKKGRYTSSTFRVYENKLSRNYIKYIAALLLALGAVGFLYNYL